MAQETKIVKGGFRATLALVISIIALILSIVAYTSTAREEDLNARIKDLQASLENMKQESSKQVDKLRDETANALEKLGKVVKKSEEAQE
jgi:predicted PurR-regulated permease PerM